MKPTAIKILRALLQNPKSSDRDISRIVNVSQPTVSRVRNQLEKTGIIQSYETIPNLKALGYHIIACGTSVSEDLPKDNHVILAWPLSQIRGAMYSISVHKDYDDYLQFASTHRIHADTTLLSTSLKPAKPLSFKDISIE